MSEELPEGLALAILAELDDGVIACGPGGEVRWIEDAPGGGARICFTLRYAGEARG